MPTVDEAVENITWAAGDSFLSDYLNEVLNEVFERVEEDNEEPGDVLEEVIYEWLDRTYIYDKVYDYLYEHIDDECMRTSDCMEIITDYGFSDSLAAAVDMGCDLSDADETVVACAVLHMNLPSTDDLQEEIVRQISESTDYREQLFEYEKAEVGDDEKYSADGGED
jgi:hypothetical protein